MAPPKKNRLNKLKANDPEFYSSLLDGNSKIDPSLLLEDSSDESSHEEQTAGEDSILEEAEDEGSSADSGDEDAASDTEDISDDEGQTDLTIPMLEKWAILLQGNKPETVLEKLCNGLNAASVYIKNEENYNQMQSEKDSGNNITLSKYIVSSHEVFQGVITLAVHATAPAFRTLLALNNLTMISSANKFKKYSQLMQNYVDALFSLTDCDQTDSASREKIVRNCIAPFYAAWKKDTELCKKYIEKLVHIWSTDPEQSVKQIAFVAIAKVVKLMDAETCDFTLKSMYEAYIRESVNSSNNSSVISMMRLTLSELYGLDEKVIYHHAFDRLSDMQRTLKIAIDCPTPEYVEQVYTLQFLHGLHLWASVVASGHSFQRPNRTLDPMLQYLVEICLSTLALQPSVMYYPYILNLCNIMTDLCANTQFFVPILPYLTMVFTDIKDSKCNKNADTKVLEVPDWHTVIKLTELQQSSSVTMKSLLHRAATGIARYLSVEGCRLAFPELVEPLLYELMKTPDMFSTGLCRMLETKVSEHSEVIASRRNDVDFQLKQVKNAHDWEVAMKQETRLPIDELCIKLATYDVQTNRTSSIKKTASAIKSKKMKRKRDKLKKKSKNELKEL